MICLPAGSYRTSPLFGLQWMTQVRCTHSLTVLADGHGQPPGVVTSAHLRHLVGCRKASTQVDVTSSHPSHVNCSVNRFQYPQITKNYNISILLKELLGVGMDLVWNQPEELWECGRSLLCLGAVQSNPSPFSPLLQ